jgi:L-ascorbate metabolism protein UlaG (beta-lactamase superfamily)
MRLLRKDRAMRPIGALIPALVIWLVPMQSVKAAGLSRYRDLVVADAPGYRSSLGKLRVTYLGTNGYRFAVEDHALVIDPYVTRVGLGAFLFPVAIRSSIAEVEKRADLLAGAEVILVTHGHADHLLDVPPIMQMTGARLLASPTAIALAIAAGAPAARCAAVLPDEVRQIGPWKIRVLPATHDRVFPIGVPFSGPRKSSGPPRKASDWVCGEPLSFLIEAAGKRIYIDSGGTPAQLPPNDLGPIDLAILGVALPDSRARFAAVVRQLRPRFVLPSHQDNFFRPLELGFSFGPLTDFPAVQRGFERNKLPGRLILLDYFQPWTLR